MGCALFSPLYQRAVLFRSSAFSPFSSSAILSCRVMDRRKLCILRRASTTMVKADRDSAPAIPHSPATESPRANLPSSTTPAFMPDSMGSGAHTDAQSASSTSASSAIQFLTLCQRLKTTKRAGWINHGVEHPESIADHMYRMAVMAIIMNDIPGIDKDRCVKMAIVHDIAEAIVGDITPRDGVPKDEKSRREREAIDSMCSMLGKGFSVDELKELWNEYEMNSSPEAKLVKDFDKVEMILQALEYETSQGKDLEDFFRSTAGKFQTDLGRAWAKEIIAKRRPM